MIRLGQGIDQEKMIAELESCLLQESEDYLYKNNILINDPFPVNL